MTDEAIAALRQEMRAEFAAFCTRVDGLPSIGAALGHDVHALRTAINDMARIAGEVEALGEARTIADIIEAHEAIRARVAQAHEAIRARAALSADADELLCDLAEAPCTDGEFFVKIGYMLRVNTVFTRLVLVHLLQEHLKRRESVA